MHHFLGVAVLQALGAEPKDSPRSKDTCDSHLLSNGVCDSPVQEDEEVRSDCEDPSLLPLPRPRAATVVPEEKQDNSASVAITVPVALPHPPPSLHILPPTPELQRAHRGAPAHLSSSMVKCKPEELFINLPDGSSSEDVSPLTLESADSDMINQSLSDLPSDRNTPPSPATPTSLLPPLAPSNDDDDDNNNPGELELGSALDSRGEADGSSTHSTDSIDFFSAREKFLGLAQDGRIRTLSEQAQQKTPVSAEREPEVCEDEEEQMSETSRVRSHPASSVCLALQLHDCFLGLPLPSAVNVFIFLS